MSAFHEPPPPDARPAPSSTELRIAVMMSGGVSLAVWMGGVACELDLLRRKKGIYRDLATLTGVEPMVDLITGTSAGGLNGTLLSAAVAWQSDLGPLQDLWLGEGDFERLLRPLTEKSPPSLLQGDGYFLQIVQKALAGLHASGGPAASQPGPGQPDYPPLHAVITTTLMKAFNHEETDALGQPMSQPTHLGLFHFSKSSARNDFGVAPNADAAIANLARAARSSASFPVAFEPSFVTIGAGDPGGADLKEVADFGLSRFVMDGGLMDNEPIEQLLDLIADQPAFERPVRRVLLYVEPLAGPSPEPAADVRDQLPALKTVLTDTISVPRQQSTAEQIDRLTQRANQHNVIQNVRRSLFDPMIDRAAATAFVETATRLRPALQQTRAANAGAIWRVTANSDQSLSQARQNVLTTLDLLRRALLTGLAPEEAAPRRIELSALLGTITQTAESNKTDPARDDVTTGTVQRTQTAIRAAMEPLFEMVRVTAPGGDGKVEQLLLEVEGIRQLALARTARPLEGAGEVGAPDAASVFDALTDLDVLQSAVTDGQSHNPQQIDLIQISSIVPPERQDRIWPPATQLTGIQLMHFGAFYLSGWRQNDWIGGRLDGSHELVGMLADPVALLRQADSVPDAVDKVAALLTITATRDGETAGFRAAVTPLLAAVDEDDPATVSAARDCLTAYLAREAAYGVLAEELTRLRTELVKNQADGATLTPADSDVVTEPALGPNPSADAIEKAWNACGVGSDTLHQQIGSDRFAQVATQAAAVGVGVVGTQKLPVLDKVTAIVRPALRFAHFLTTPQSADRSSTFAIGAVMLAASFLALVCAATSSSAVYMAIAAVPWLAVTVGGLLLRHGGRIVGALVFLGATIGLGIASRHWHNPALIVLGAGTAVIASFLAMYACHVDRPKPIAVASS